MILITTNDQHAAFQTAIEDYEETIDGANISKHKSTAGNLENSIQVSDFEYQWLSSEGCQTPKEQEATGSWIDTSKFGPALSPLGNGMSYIERRVLAALEAQTGDQCQALFHVEWNPFEFMKNQFGEDRIQLGQVLTISGSEHCVQATTCEDYVRTTWPHSGLQFLELMQDAFSSPLHRSQGTIHNSHLDPYCNF